jgi:crotonobetainyl-CoA:carnitine CoA-transferase CaiB-like acyl-CoA transferase
MADWMNVPYLQAHYGGKAPPLLGLRHPSIAPYGAFACSDGAQVLLSVQNDREWRALSGQVLGRPDLAEDPAYATNIARVSRMAEVETLIAPTFAAIDRETAIGRLTDAGIACGRLSSLDDLASHPQARHLTAESPTGPVRLMDRGVRHIGQERPSTMTVPALDQHGAVLRAEFLASVDKEPTQAQ